MVKHFEALSCASKLSLYCKERFNGNERECDCIFRVNERCGLHNFLWQNGDDVAVETMEKVFDNMGKFND